MTADQIDPATPGGLASSLKRLARIAGVLYLVVGIFGGFATGYVTARVYVAGDAATTAANVVANAGLLRMGVVADLLQATVFVFLAMTLFLVLKHVDRNAATAMVILVAIATTLMCSTRFSSLRPCWLQAMCRTWPPSVPQGRMHWCCSCSTSTTTAS